MSFGWDRLRRVHAIFLVAYAALLGLFEGPAEVLCVLSLLTSLALAWHDRAHFGARGWLMLTGIVVYGLAGLPGAMLTTARLSSEDALRPLLALAFVVGAFGFARADDRTLKRAGTAFLVACVINAAYGLLQVVFGELPLDALFLKTAHSPQIYVPGHAYDPTSGAPSGYRAASGLFYNRLKLGHVGIMGLGLLGLIGAAPRQRPAVRLGVSAAFAVLAAGVVLTYTRGALVALFLAGTVTSALLFRARVVLASLAVALTVGLGTLALSPLLLEHLSSAVRDLGLRAQIFSGALAMLGQHPFLGVGHGVYRHVAPKYFPPDVTPAWLIDAHNLLLHVAVESGSVGLLGFGAALTLGVLALVTSVRAERRASEPRAVLHRLALFGLVAVLVLGTSHFALHHAPVALIYWSLVGVAAGARRAHGRVVRGPRESVLD